MTLSQHLARNLKARAEKDASPLFKITWKDRVTSSGLVVPLMTARAVGVDRAHWLTPQARDWKGPSGRAAKGLAMDVPAQALLAEGANGGQLNPSHVRWMMGLPAAWDECGIAAMGGKPMKDETKGARIRRLRIAKGLTQTELARRTGTWQANVGALEAGDTPLGWRRAERFAAVLGVSAAELLGLSAAKVQALRDKAAARLAARDGVKS